MFVPLQLRLDDLLTCPRAGVSVKAQSFQHQSTKFCAPNPAAEFGRCPKRKKGGLTASSFFVFFAPRRTGRLISETLRKHLDLVNNNCETNLSSFGINQILVEKGPRTRRGQSDREVVPHQEDTRWEQKHYGTLWLTLYGRPD